MGRLTEQVSEIQADASAFFYSNRPMVWKGGQLQVSDHIILSVPQEVQNVIINEKTGKIKERTHNSYILYQRRLLAAVALYKNNKAGIDISKETGLVKRKEVLAKYDVVESSNDRKTNEIKLLIEDDITKAINSWIEIDDGDGIYLKIDRFSNKAIPEIDIDDIIVGDAPANLEETKDYLPLFYHTDKKLAINKSDGSRMSHEEFDILASKGTWEEEIIPALQIPLHKQLISGDNVEFLLGESPKGLSGNQVSFEEEVARQLALTEFRNAAVFVAERDKQKAVSEKSIGISYSFWNDDWRIKSFPAGKFVSNNLFTFSNSEFLPEKVKILLRYNQISGIPIATLSLSDQKSTGPRTGGADYGRKAGDSNTEAVAGDIKVELKKIGDSKYYEGLADINWGNTRLEETEADQYRSNTRFLPKVSNQFLYSR